MYNISDKDEYPVEDGVYERPPVLRAGRPHRLCVDRYHQHDLQVGVP